GALPVLARRPGAPGPGHPGQPPVADRGRRSPARDPCRLSAVLPPTALPERRGGAVPRPAARPRLRARRLAGGPRLVPEPDAVRADRRRRLPGAAHALARAPRLRRALSVHRADARAALRAERLARGPR